MKKFFLIPLMTLVCSVMAWAGVAKIGTTEYETLNAAFAAANNGDAIDLLTDVSVSEAIEVNNIAVTLHMYGRTITNNVGESKRLFYIGGTNGSLTIMGNEDGKSANAKMIIPDENVRSRGFVDYKLLSEAGTTGTSFAAYNVDFEGATLKEPTTAEYNTWKGKTGTCRADGLGAFFFMRADEQHILLQDCNGNCKPGSNRGFLDYEFYDIEPAGGSVRIIRGVYEYRSNAPVSMNLFRTLINGENVFQGLTIKTQYGRICEAQNNNVVTYTDCTLQFIETNDGGWKAAGVSSQGYSETELVNSVRQYKNAFGIGYYGDYRNPGISVVNSGNYEALHPIETVSSGGIIIVKGGTFRQLGTDVAPSTPSSANNPAVIYMHGGAKSGDTWQPTTGLVKISGGDFYGNIVITNSNNNDMNATSDLEISGGVFHDINRLYVGAVKCNVEITGGTFYAGTEAIKTQLKGYVPAGYEKIDNLDGSFTVTKQQSTADTEVSWTEASDWSDNAVPTASSEVSVGADVTVTVGNGSSDTEAEAQSIDLAANSTLVVKDNAILVVGEGGITGNGSVVVEDGGQLLISPYTETDVQPQGTVTYKAQHARTDAEFLGGHVWEHIALPTIGYPTITATPSGYTTYLNLWNLNTGWVELDDFEHQFTQNFVGYSLTNSSTTGNVTYTFTGTLVGNADQIMDFSAEGFTYFANSYTGPIDIKALLAQFETGSDVQRAVYLWDPLNEGYIAITTRNAGTGIYPAVIKPMQAFFVFSHDAASQEVLYESSVWAPMLANKAAAPARDKKVNNDIVISMLSENGRRDNVALSAIEEAEDNEILKLNNPATSVNIYALSENGNMSYLAENNFNTIYLGITTNSSASYTMQFSGLTDGTYELYDIVANRAIAIVEGATYTFSETANSTVENRFSVRKISQVVTSMDQVNANNAKVWQTGETLTITDNSAMNDINIYSLNGSLVLSQPATSAAIETISLNGLNNGAYLVKVGNVSAKIVK